jgi:hypothetical protein
LQYGGSASCSEVGRNCVVLGSVEIHYLSSACICSKILSRRWHRVEPMPSLGFQGARPIELSKRAGPNSSHPEPVSSSRLAALYVAALAARGGCSTRPQQWPQIGCSVDAVFAAVWGRNVVRSDGCTAGCILTAGLSASMAASGPRLVKPACLGCFACQPGMLVRGLA